MKKIVFILFIVLYCSSLFSQDDKRLSYGPVFGGSMSAFYSDNKMITDNYTGFYAGGFAEYKILSKFAAKLEVLYHENGGNNFDIYRIYSASSPILQGYKSSDLVVRNIEFPIQFSYKLMNLGPLELRPFVGASFAYNLQSRALVTKNRSVGGTSITTESSNYDATDRLENMSYSVLGGLGFRTYFGKFGVNIDLKYTYGLNDLNNVGNDELMLNYGGLSLGILF